MTQRILAEATNFKIIQETDINLETIIIATKKGELFSDTARLYRFDSSWATSRLLFKDVAKELNNKDEQCEYPIEFQSEFFKNIPELVYLEKMIRQKKLKLQALIAIVECFEDSLSRTFGMILLMHNRDIETKKMIFNQLSNVCQQGLTQLLSDYENFGG